MYDINFQSISDISPEVQTTVETSLPFTTTSVFLSTFPISTTESSRKHQPTSSSINTNEFIPPNATYQSTLQTSSTTLTMYVFFFKMTAFFVNVPFVFLLYDTYIKHI